MSSYHSVRPGVRRRGSAARPKKNGKLQFEKNYRDYCDKISEIDLPSISDRIGAIRRNGQVIIPFFDESYSVSKNGIYHSSGKQAEYGICVILSKYILLCPDKPHFDGQWVSFKDFRRVSHFTNVTFFASDVEQIIEKSFSDNLSKLAAACKDLGGTKEDTWSSYDLSFSFRALPRISLLLLFNDGDDEFPAKSTVLFQKHSEYYLDPESLAMLGAALARKLRKRSK